MHRRNEQGSLMLSVLLAITIIAIWFAISMRGTKSSDQQGENATSTTVDTSSDINVIQAGREGEESLRQSNQKLQQDQDETQVR